MAQHFFDKNGFMTAQSNTAGIVVVGNEILSAKIVDQNGPYLCRQLRLLGVHTRRIVTVPDDMAMIGQEVCQSSNAFKWVFTSGGIGPTHDDMTIAAVARAFKVETLEHPEMAKRIRGHYGDKLTQAHLRMALTPAGAEIIPTPDLRFPQLRFKNIFILPGVPELFRYKFDAIKHLFQSKPIVLKELYLRADEGEIAQALLQVEQAHPGVLIGSYPSFRPKEYSVRIAVEGEDAALVNQATSNLLKCLQALPVQVIRSK